MAVRDVIRTLSQAVNNVVSGSLHQRCGGHCSAGLAVSTVKLCVYLVGCEGLLVDISHRAGNT